ARRSDGILRPDRNGQSRPRPAPGAGAAAFGRTNMKRYLTTAAVAGFAMLLAAAVSASAAEIKVISSNALKTVLEELAPAFEKATEHKLVIQWGAAVPLKA